MIQQKPPVDTKNFILAIVLSSLIIFVWQFFYVLPQQKEQQAQLAQQQTQTAGQAATTGQAGATGQAANAPASTVGAVQPREVLLGQAPRIKIDTPDLDGTINLKGAVLDDLKLKQYREKVDPTSPEITLLSPSGAKDAYFVAHFMVPVTGQTVKVPGPDTLWSAPANAVLGVGAPVTLSWDNGEGITFKRTITIDDRYMFNIQHTIENKSAAPIAVTPYAHIQRQDMPVIAGWYVFFEGMLGVQGGVLTEVNYSDVAEPDGAVKTDSTGGWLGFTDKYWSTALIPGKTTRVNNTYQHDRVNNRDVYQAQYQATDPMFVQAGAAVTYTDHLFAGAKDVKQIYAIGDKYELDNFDLMIDWGYFKFLTKPMFWLLDFCKSLVGNFGLAILLVTVIVKLAVFPLANRSYASMSKMKKLQPQMEEMKARFGDDRMGMQKEMMELYKREKVSPLSGCLPIVVQIPIFFALYKVILTSLELRHAPFFGWIQDLSAGDPTSLFNLFGLLPFSVPQALLIGVWPILMGITMWVQMRLNPTPTDPIQASMFNWMPLIFTFMMASFPAGLVIYWTWSNLLSIIQQGYIMKKNGVEVDLLGNIRDSVPFLKKKTAEKKEAA
jgi:YidC/Oxa1 family membrane protein insertase